MVSVLLVGSAFLFGFLIQKRGPLHIRLVISMLMCTLGHFIYEDIFITVMGYTGRGTEALFLYLAITFVLIMIITYVNSDYPFINFSPSFAVLLSTLLFCFGALWYMGWFHRLQLWYIGEGPPVENWLWAVTKGLGFFTWVKMIDGGKIKDEP